MRNEFEEDIDESFARLFFFFLPSLELERKERKREGRERKRGVVGQREEKIEMGIRG